MNGNLVAKHPTMTKTVPERSTAFTPPKATLGQHFNRKSVAKRMRCRRAKVYAPQPLDRVERHLDIDLPAASSGLVWDIATNGLIGRVFRFLPKPAPIPFFAVSNS